MKKKISVWILIVWLAAICLSGFSKEDKQSLYCPPKYVFLFIGDGMSYPQIALTNEYLNSCSQEWKKMYIRVSDNNMLSFMKFTVSGTAQTYNKDSWIPESASAGTAIASGKKTVSECLNVSPDGSKQYQTIAELLKKKKKYKVGIVTSVNLNHATPAAFYAHQHSRTNYYAIGQELIDSGFDYFAGGAFLQPDGSNNKDKNLYDLAAEAGYQVVKTQDEVQSLRKDTKKKIVIAEHLADSDTMPYEIDRTEAQWALADYVDKGIELLENDTGFFMMVEGGKIDWACHANDAATVIQEVSALDKAVAKAVDFYLEHPSETLILVTGDHETGGISLGAGGTGYQMFLQNLKQQKISFDQFYENKVREYQKHGTTLEEVMEDVNLYYGLVGSEQTEEVQMQRDSYDSHKQMHSDKTLRLSSYEYTLLRQAYERTMLTDEKEGMSQQEYMAYGSYDPLTVTVTHLLAQKSGVCFGTYAHTALPVPVLAKGIGAGRFTGYYENTDIFQRLCAALELKQ